MTFVTLKKVVIATRKSRLLTSDFAGPSRTLGVSFTAAALSAVLVTGCGGGDSSATANPSGVATNAGNATIQPVAAAVSPDQPYVDPNVCGIGPNDALAVDPGESTVITHHAVTIGGKSIAYTATVGHLMIIDPVTSQSDAAMFYVAYMQDNPDPAKPRPVTFSYNGDPGSPSVFLLLGSFGPKWLQSSFPSFTPPASYKLPDNLDSLLDRSDLVFINPAGTGYSVVIASAKNKDSWDTDQDARSIDRFIQRYLTKDSHWNSPRFLYGELYGVTRSAALSWALHKDGIRLNGITLQPPILDYANALSAVDTFPTLAADAFYRKKTTLNPAPTDLDNHMTQARNYAGNTLALLAQAPGAVDGGFVNVHLNLNLAAAQTTGSYIGTDPVSLIQTFGNPTVLGNAPSQNNNPLYTLFPMLNPDIQIGQYDGRANYTGQGIAPLILPNSGNNGPSISSIGDVYTVLWNSYLNIQLKHTSTSSFTGLNDAVFNNWNFSHIDSTGANKGGGNTPYTAGDLAATTSLNPDLEVLQASDYFGAVMPFHQTELTLAQMPFDPTFKAKNLMIGNYPSGHMIYPNDASHTAPKGDLASSYNGVMADRLALMQMQSLQRLPSGPKR